MMMMTEISAARLNEEDKEISIKEFMKTQKQFMENMQLMFQKHATAMSRTQSSEPYRLKADEEKDYNDTPQQDSHDRAIHKNIPGASRKRKRVNQVYQNSQDTVTLHPSDSDSYQSEDSDSCKLPIYEDPFAKS